jgi:hypothetical protein
MQEKDESHIGFHLVEPNAAGDTCAQAMVGK